MCAINLGLSRPLRLNAELGTNIDHNYIRLSMTQTVFSNKNHRGTISSNVARDSKSDVYTGTRSADYNTNFDLTKDVAITAGLRADEKSLSLSSNVVLNKDIFGNDLNVSSTARSVSGGKAQYFYDVNLSRQDDFGFYITKDGFGFTREMTDSTGVIVELVGDFNHKDLYVQSGNRHIKFNKKGQSRFIPVPAYTKAMIEVDSDANQQYHISPIDSDGVIQLFPGNIEVMRFSVQPKFSLYANFDCMGEPYVDQVITSSIDAMRTDESGFAVLDIIQGEALTVLSKDGKTKNKIKFNTQGIKFSDGFAYVDKLTCQMNP